MDGEVPVPLPIVLGHEGAGVVEQVGSKVTKVAPGDHVVMSYSFCGECRNCQNDQRTYCYHSFRLNFGGSRLDGSTTLSKGGKPVCSNFFGQSSLASYAICYERNVVKVPSDVPLEILGPLACGVQTGAGVAINALKVEKDSSFAVFGAVAVGLSAIMGAKIRGAARIIAIDVLPERLDMARSFGATDTINAKENDVFASIKHIAPEGLPYILDTSGVKSAMEQSLAALAPGGTCAWVAGTSPELRISIDPTFLLYGRKLHGVVQGETQNSSEFINSMIKWHSEGLFPFDKMIKFYDAKNIDQALKDARNGKAIKPVVRF